MTACDSVIYFSIVINWRLANLCGQLYMRPDEKKCRKVPTVDMQQSLDGTHSKVHSVWKYTNFKSCLPEYNGLDRAICFKSF